MTRRALAAALLAFLGGAPLGADVGAHKAIHLSWSVQGLIKETPGRLNTWNLGVLSFTPEGRGVKPVTIPYKAIKALEFGRTPGRQGSGPQASFVKKQLYLTIVYTEPDVTTEETEPDKKKKKEEEAELTLVQERERRRKERDQEKERAEKPDAVAVFALGEAILRPTLRIVESRSGKRIHYQDAEARRSAR